MGNPLEMTPVEFEIFVRRFLEEQGRTLTDFRTEHLEKIQGPDGDYIIDVTARFNALGGDFLVLIECKRYTSDPIEREQVQALNQKRISMSAHKAMLFATTPFRAGAKEFAAAHGIALIQVTADEISYAVKSVLLNYRARFVQPNSQTLAEFLFDGRAPEQQENHPRSKEAAIQEWFVSLLRERLDYLRIISSKGYQVADSEVQSLRAQILDEEGKLENLQKGGD